jgi:hypothetical protein
VAVDSVHITKDPVHAISYKNESKIVENNRNPVTLQKHPWTFLKLR